jgi:arylsulfatase A-like enzyme
MWSFTVRHAPTVLLGALLAGCGPDRPAPPPGAPDVVLVVLDTLRPDALGAYGASVATSPAIDALAAQATRYETAWAPSSWTLPGTATIHTGLHPLRHGLRTFGDKLPDAQLTLAERLGAAGWATGGWSDNANFGEKNALHQGFDEFVSSDKPAVAYPNAGVMIKAARKWITEAEGPVFTALQPMNCHGPYRVPKSALKRVYGRRPLMGFRYYKGPMGEIMTKRQLDARERVGSRYLQSAREQQLTAVRYATDEVGKLLSHLRSTGRYDNALIIVTADHGEEMFEHGGFSHGYTLHREVVQVPLIIKYPGQTAGAVVKGPASLLDVTPTVLAAVGLDKGLPEGTFDGVDLRAAAKDGVLPPRPLVLDLQWPKRTVARGLLDGDLHLIHIEKSYDGLVDARKLYDLRADPAERSDLAPTDAARLSAAEQRLAALWTTLAAGTPIVENVLSDMDQEKLKLLGYME